MSDATTLSRRRFLGSTAAAASALTLGLSLASKDAEAAGNTAVNSWLAIGSDDSVTLTIGISDMGQGSASGMAQVLCEDLMVSPARVRVVQGGPTLASPAPLGTALVTGGSSAIRNNFWKLRDAGAAAREMLVAAAMARFGETTRSNCSVADGLVTHLPSGATLRYGEIAADAARLPVPVSAPLVPDSQFQYIGRTFPRADLPSKVDGSAVYGLDVRVPGMVYAVIRHAPAFGATLAATPSTPAGMLAVVPTRVVAGAGRGADLAGNVNAVAVVGSTTWDAWQAARSMSLKWTLPANAASMSSAQILADAQALLAGGTPYVAGGANPPGTVYTVERSAADPVAAIAGSTQVVDAVYSLPYLSHACMEVLNCTVDYVPGQRCEVWAPTQVARSALSLVCTLTGLSAGQVVFHTTLLGGGLGRKLEIDFIGQAVQVAMAVQRPVKLMWPREEDFGHDQYRPMAVVRARAGLDANGFITGWAYRNVSQSIGAQRGAVLPATGDGQGWEGSRHLPYDFGARLTEWVSHTAQIPVGYWRSVGASINTFAVESMIDELAAAAGRDPYQFRRARLTDPRWLAVLDAAAAAAGWGSAPPAGRARGIAVGTAFNTLVAQVVEVSNASGVPRVTRVWVAVDSYLMINPGQVEAQIVGGVVHGINAALYGRQTFVSGAAQSRNFSTNRVLRLNEAPQVTVVRIPAPAQADRTQPIGGIGELGVPTLAPALANAWARLTGQRVRSLPFVPNATMGG